LDIHSAAQALALFSRVGGYEALNQKIANWMLDNMRDKKGFFYCQKNRFFINRIPYMRWSQAWALHALCSLMLSNEK
jgi:hypothetical protein